MRQLSWSLFSIVCWFHCQFDGVSCKYFELMYDYLNMITRSLCLIMKCKICYLIASCKTRFFSLLHLQGILQSCCCCFPYTCLILKPNTRTKYKVFSCNCPLQCLTRKAEQNLFDKNQLVKAHVSTQSFIKAAWFSLYPV